MNGQHAPGVSYCDQELDELRPNQAYLNEIDDLLLIVVMVRILACFDGSFGILTELFRVHVVMMMISFVALHFILLRICDDNIHQLEPG